MTTRSRPSTPSPCSRSRHRSPALPSALAAHLAAELAELLADAERDAAAAQTVNTTRAYASHWNQFQAWCDRYQLESLPASAPVIGLYVTSLAKRGVAVSTIRRRASAIARVHGSAPHKKKTALLRDPLLELIDRTDPTTVGLRDRALLLLGFAVGLRRSELVAAGVAIAGWLVIAFAVAACAQLRVWVAGSVHHTWAR